MRLEDIWSYGIEIDDTTEANHFNSVFYNNGSGDFGDPGASVQRHAKFFDYIPGASGNNPNYLGGTAPNFDFTLGSSAGNIHGSGMPMQIKMFGSTSDTPGSSKWVSREKTSTF